MDVLRFDLARIYASAAHAILNTSVKHPKANEIHNDPKLQHAVNNADLGLVAITCVFSFLSMEAFVNFHMYRYWQKHERHAASVAFCKLLRPKDESLDDWASVWNQLKKHNLPDRINLLCDLYQINKPHLSNNTLWKMYKEDCKLLRNYFIHPNPQDFDDVMKQISERPYGSYVETARAVGQILGEQLGLSGNVWDEERMLFGFPTTRILPNIPSSS